jgi:predicted HTH transcriptional regulator
MATVADRTLLVVNVGLSNRRPHFVKKLGQRGGTFVRLGASNRQADEDLIRDLKRGTNDQFFDQLPVITQTPDDLDVEALEQMLKRPITLEALRTLGLVTQDQGRWVPTYGGVLLAGKEREHVFPLAYVQCARFRGEQRLDIFDRIEVHEHLPLAVDKVMDFLKRHAFLTAEFGDVRRRDVWSIPIDAIREVVINALVHASYSAKGSPIRVAFCDDRIEVDSPGGLMPGITVEDMIRGTSSIRNPTLARVFAEMGLIEQWGTGIPGVFSAVATDGLPAPEITELPKALRFTVYIKNHHPQIEATPGTDRGARWGVEEPGSHKPNTHDRARSTHDGTYDEVLGTHDGTHDLSLDDRAEFVLSALADGPLSRQELLRTLGLANIYQSFQRHVAPLIEAGLVEQTLPDTPRSKNQRYRVTDAGRSVLVRTLDGANGPDLPDNAV